MTKEELIKIRTELGLTQDQMSKATGIQPSMYQKLEQGKREFKEIHINVIECVRKGKI